MDNHFNYMQSFMLKFFLSIGPPILNACLQLQTFMLLKNVKDMKDWKTRILSNNSPRKQKGRIICWLVLPCRNLS